MRRTSFISRLGCSWPMRSRPATEKQRRIFQTIGEKRSTTRPAHLVDSKERGRRHPGATRRLDRTGATGGLKQSFRATRAPHTTPPAFAFYASLGPARTFGEVASRFGVSEA